MRHRRTICFLLASMLVTALVSPAAFAAWVCEGRKCGTTLWGCCCVSPEPSQDGNCPDRPGGSGNGTGMSCPAGCECVLTVTTVDHERRVPLGISAIPDYQPALLPAPVAVLPALPTESVGTTFSLRGPPPSPGGLPAVGLRGPPSLTFNFGC